MDENKHRRRWLSFGIRDLLWAMVVVGLGLGLWKEHSRSTKLEQRVEEQHWEKLILSSHIKRIGHQVNYDATGRVIGTQTWQDGVRKSANSL